MPTVHINRSDASKNASQEERSSKAFTRNKSRKIERIKESTYKLIQEKGYENTTNHGIAKAAEVSVGLLYKYFNRGKIDILRTLIEDQSKSFELDQKKIGLNTITIENWKKILKNLFKVLIARHKTEKSFVQAIEIAMLSNPEIFSSTRAIASELMTMTHVIEQFEQIGIVTRSIDSQELHITISILDHLIHQYLFFNNIPVENEAEFIQLLFDILVKLLDLKQT